MFKNHVTDVYPSETLVLICKTRIFHLRVVVPYFSEYANFRVAFKALSNIYNGAFCKNKYSLNAAKYF